MEGERIAKYLARMGVASRRRAEVFIKEGRIQINGSTLDSLGYRLQPGDEVAVDGEKLPSTKPQTRLWLLHKPAGVITSHHDEKNRQTVFSLVPEEYGLVLSVGRLDYNTEGLLLLTNNGELVHHLESPETGWVRRYRARVFGNIPENMIEQLKEGITVDKIQYGSIEVVLESAKGKNSWLSISLKEGKNREVRNALEYFGLKVSRLIRVSYGPFQLGRLLPGKLKEIPYKTVQEQLGSKVAL